MRHGGAVPRPEPTSAPIRLLWTGGWDSSFRLLQALLVERRAVQPIYLVNHERDSLQYELRAMKAMRDGVLPRLARPATLAPTEVHIRSDFPVPVEVDRLYAQVRARVHIGTQYRWLAAVGQALGWEGVELSMERYEDGPSPLQRLIFDEAGVLNGSAEAQLFRCWSFPVLHLSKTDMADIAREQGFLDLLALRWFCHYPLAGKPCGVCRPCRLAYRSDGVDFANPVLAKARGVLTKLRGRSVRRFAWRLRRRAARA
jgi:7-cyano-7-deazaguanine synthase